MTHWQSIIRDLTPFLSMLTGLIVVAREIWLGKSIAALHKKQLETKDDLVKSKEGEIKQLESSIQELARGKDAHLAAKDETMKGLLLHIENAKVFTAPSVKEILDATKAIYDHGIQQLEAEKEAVKQEAETKIQEAKAKASEIQKKVADNSPDLKEEYMMKVAYITSLEEQLRTLRAAQEASAAARQTFTIFEAANLQPMNLEGLKPGDLLYSGSGPTGQLTPVKTWKSGDVVPVPAVLLQNDPASPLMLTYIPTVEKKTEGDT
jgi:hypothetical protein